MSKQRTPLTSSPVSSSSARALPHLLPAIVVGTLPIIAPGVLTAAELEASDGVANQGNYFGYYADISGGLGIMGAASEGGDGSTYLFKNLDTATGVLTQSAKLKASDAQPNDLFGWGLGISGNLAVINAAVHQGSRGAAYVFRNLDTATGTVTQNAKLMASDGIAGDQLGNSGSVSGTMALLGANGADPSFASQGAAYVFRNLDTATGTVTQNVKLIASDGAAGDSLGISVGLSGSIGVVGAFGHATNGATSGAVYVFRNLDTATGTVTQNVKLVASDAAASDYFGFTVAIDGNIALSSAYQDDDKGSNSGSVYVFRNLDTATGTVTQNAKLVASDGAASDNFGKSVGMSGTTGIVGSWYDDDKGSNSGSAYIFKNLDTATGTVNQTVKVLASNGAANDNFGHSVEIDGDTFIVGASRGDGVFANTGNGYTGSVSAITTLDAGNTSKSIDAISFVSRTDWVIGAFTDNNQVTLTSGDSATVNTAGTAIHIGKEAGSDNNRLVIAGAVTSTEIRIGKQGENEGNTLQLNTGATLNLQSILLADGSVLSIQGDYSDASTLLAYFGATELKVWESNAWTAVTLANFNDAVDSTYDAGSGFTNIRSSAIPEASTAALLAVLSLGMTVRRRRH